MQIYFIRVTSCRVVYPYCYLDVPVLILKSHFCLHDLGTRIIVQGSVFLMKLVNSAVSCPELLLKIPLHIPGHTRSQDMFERLHYPTCCDSTTSGQCCYLFSFKVANILNRVLLLFTAMNIIPICTLLYYAHVMAFLMNSFHFHKNYIKYCIVTSVKNHYS